MIYDQQSIQNLFGQEFTHWLHLRRGSSMWKLWLYIHSDKPMWAVPIPHVGDIYKLSFKGGNE